MKIEKNYYRILLMELENETKYQPIIFTGKYKHNADPNWVTFTTIRRYIYNKRTQTLCNHINISKNKVNKYITLSSNEHNRKFYICGRISTYNHFGDLRGCIILDETCNGTPLWLTKLSKKENEETIKRVLKVEHLNLL